jgi:peroxiredoxin
MRTTLYSLFFLLPFLANGQHEETADYHQRIEDYRNAIAEKRKTNPDEMVMISPDCVIDARIPEFTATTLDGQPFTSEDFIGKITVLNFWQISCPPCIAEIPGFNQVIDKFGRDKVNYIAIGLDDEADIRGFLNKHPWHFTQLSSGMELIFDVFRMGWGYPTTYVVDENAAIIAAFSGGSTDPVEAVKNIDEHLSSIINAALTD